MRVDYIILVIVGGVSIAGGLFLLREAKRIRSNSRLNANGSYDNVYEALGFPAPDEMQEKAYIAMSMSRDIKEHQLDKQTVSDVLNISEPRLDAILRGRFSDVSLEEMRQFHARVASHVAQLAKESRPVYEKDDGRLSENSLNAIREQASEQRPEGEMVSRKSLF